MIDVSEEYMPGIAGTGGPFIRGALIGAPP